MECECVWVCVGGGVFILNHSISHPKLTIYLHSWGKIGLKEVDRSSGSINELKTLQHGLGQRTENILKVWQRIYFEHMVIIITDGRFLWFFSHDFNWKCYILDRRFHRIQHHLYSALWPCACSFPLSLGLYMAKCSLCTSPPMWRPHNSNQSNKQHIYVQITHISANKPTEICMPRVDGCFLLKTSRNSWSFHLISLTRFPSYFCFVPDDPAHGWYGIHSCWQHRFRPDRYINSSTFAFITPGCVHI